MCVETEWKPMQLPVYISATVPGACGGNEVECSRVRAEGPQSCSLELNQLNQFKGAQGVRLAYTRGSISVFRMTCLEY